MIGPFKIDKVVSPMAMRLVLPESWKIHLTFQVKLLEPFQKRSQAPPPDLNKVLADMKDLLLPSFEIEQILDSNYDKEEKRVLYLVQGKDYPNEKDWTEEPFEHFGNVMECLRNSMQKIQMRQEMIGWFKVGHIPFFPGTILTRFLMVWAQVAIFLIF
jgi:hypothetical protein